MMHSSDDEYEKEDTSRTSTTKSGRGGHRGERALPIQLQRDPAFREWYHQMKQKQQGLLAKIIGVPSDRITPDFTIEGRQAQVLATYYYSTVSKSDEKPSAPSSSKPRDDESSDSDSEEDPLDAALQEIEGRLAQLPKIGGAKQQATYLRNTNQQTRALVEEYSDDASVLNKLKVMYALYDQQWPASDEDEQ